MIAPETGPTRQPQTGGRSGFALAFAFAGAPLAWLVQEVADYGLFSLPCFPSPARRAALPPEAGWVWVAGPAVLLGCLLVSLAATWVAWRLFAGARNANDPELIGADQAGNGRTRFLSFWGLLLGGGFSVVILSHLFVMLTVSPCAV